MRKHPGQEENNRKVTLPDIGGTVPVFFHALFIQAFAQERMTSAIICSELRGWRMECWTGSSRWLFSLKRWRGNGYLNSMYPYLFLYIPAVLRLLGVSPGASIKTDIYAWYCHCGDYIPGIQIHLPDQNTPVFWERRYIPMPPTVFTNIYARARLGNTGADLPAAVIIAGFYPVMLLLGRQEEMAVAGNRPLRGSDWKPCAQHSHDGRDFRRLLSYFYQGSCSVIKDVRELLKAAGLTVLLNLWFLVPFLFFYLKGKTCTRRRWTGAAFGVFHQCFLPGGYLPYQRLPFLSLGLPIPGLCGNMHPQLVCRKSKRKRTVKETASSPIFSATRLCADLPLWQAISGKGGRWKELIPAIEPVPADDPVPLAASGPCRNPVYLCRRHLAVRIRRCCGPTGNLAFAFLVGWTCSPAWTSPIIQNNFAYKDYVMTPQRWGIGIKS